MANRASSVPRCAVLIGTYLSGKTTLLDCILSRVDLVSERAYKFHAGAPSDLMEIPASILAREQEERAHLLEALADYDDALLEQILERRVPGTETIYENLTRDLQLGVIEPKEDWPGWDEVSAHLPESETLDLINKLRSLKQGTATFECVIAGSIISH